MTTLPPNITTNWPRLSNADLVAGLRKYNEKKATEIVSKMAANAAAARLDAAK
jgi:hypothetical protein